MATNVIHGRDLIISLNGTAIAAARSCDISVEDDMIEVTSPSSGRAKAYRAGRYGWTVDVSCLVLSPDMVISTGQQLTFSCKVGSTTYLTGSVIRKGSKITGSVGNLAQGSYSFIGTGPLSAQ